MILHYRHPPQMFHKADRFRANAERAFSAIKGRQGPVLRARSEVTQRHETAWKIMARIVDLLARSRAAQRGP